MAERPPFRYSDVFNQASPRAQEYMQATMGESQGGELKPRGEAVQAIMDALAKGQEYDFASNFDIGSPEGMQDFMGTIAGVSAKVGPAQRSLLQDQAQKSMLGQMTSDLGDRPLQQHAMGQMLRQSIDVGGAPMPDPSLGNQLLGASSGQGIPVQAPSPGGALNELWRKKMEQLQTALEVGEITMQDAIKSGYDPNWETKPGPSR